MKSILTLVISFVILMVAYKVIEKDSCKHEIIHQQIQPEVKPVPRPEPETKPAPEPIVYKEYHCKDDFWKGYFDGFKNIPVRDNCDDYITGYNKGVLDRKMRNHHYYHEHCPPGFYLRFPGFNLNIR